MIAIKIEKNIISTRKFTTTLLGKRELKNLVNFD